MLSVNKQSLPKIPGHVLFQWNDVKFRIWSVILKAKVSDTHALFDRHLVGISVFAPKYQAVFMFRNLEIITSLQKIQWAYLFPLK